MVLPNHSPAFSSFLTSALLKVVEERAKALAYGTAVLTEKQRGIKTSQNRQALFGHVSSWLPSIKQFSPCSQVSDPVHPRIRAHKAYAQMHFFEKSVTFFFFFYNQDSKMDKCQDLLTYEQVIRCSLKSSHTKQWQSSSASRLKSAGCLAGGSVRAGLPCDDRTRPQVFLAAQQQELCTFLWEQLGAKVYLQRVPVKQMFLTSLS